MRSATQLEQGIANLNASLGGVDPSTLDKLTASIQQIGTESKFSAVEVAAVADSLAKAGFGTEELLNGATKAVVDLSQATGEGLDPAMTAVISTMSTWDKAIVGNTLAVTDAARVADVFTIAANESAAGMTDINAGMRSLGPVAAMLNIPFEDSAAAIALFTNYGLKGADAGVSLARGLQNLADPTSEASTLMSELGIAAFDSNQEFVGMPSLFRQLQDGMSGMGDQAKFAALSTIFGAEAMDVMGLAILQGADPLEAMIALMGESGAAAEQSALRMDTLGAQFDTLVEGVTTFLGSLVQGLIPGLRFLVDTANMVVDVLMKIPAPIKTIIGAIAGALAAFGAINIAMTTSQALSGLLGISMSGIGASMLALVPIIAAVAAVIGGLYLAWRTNFLGIRDLVDNVVDSAKQFKRSWDAIGSLTNNPISRLLSSLGAAFESLDWGWSDDFADVLFDLSDVVEEFVDGFEDAWESFADIVPGGTTAFGEFMVTIDRVGSGVSTLSRLLYSLGAGIRAVADTTGFGWLGTLAAGLDTAAASVDELIGHFTGLRNRGIAPVEAALFALGIVFPTLYDTMRNAATVVRDLTGAFSAFVDGDYGVGFRLIGEAAQTAWALIRDGATALSGVVVRIASWTVETAQSMYDAVASWVSDTAWPAARGAAGVVAGVILDIAGWAQGAIPDFISDVASWVVDTGWPAAQGAAGAITGVLLDIASWARGTAEQIWPFITSWVESLVSIASAAAGSVRDVVINIASWARGTAARIWDFITGWVESLVAIASVASGSVDDVLLNIASWARGTAANVWEFITDWVESLVAIASAASGSVRDVIVNIASWARGTAPNIWEFVTSWLNSLVSIASAAAADIEQISVNILAWGKGTFADLRTFIEAEILAPNVSLSEVVVNILSFKPFLNEPINTAIEDAIGEVLVSLSRVAVEVTSFEYDTPDMTILLQAGVVAAVAGIALVAAPVTVPIGLAIGVITLGIGAGLAISAWAAAWAARNPIDAVEVLMNIVVALGNVENRIFDAYGVSSWGDFALAVAGLPTTGELRREVSIVFDFVLNPFGDRQDAPLGEQTSIDFDNNLIFNHTGEKVLVGPNGQPIAADDMDAIFEADLHLDQPGLQVNIEGGYKWVPKSDFITEFRSQVETPITSILPGIGANIGSRVGSALSVVGSSIGTQAATWGSVLAAGVNQLPIIASTGFMGVQGAATSGLSTIGASVGVSMDGITTTIGTKAGTWGTTLGTALSTIGSAGAAAGGMLANLTASLGLELDGINTTISTRSSTWGTTLSTALSSLGGGGVAAAGTAAGAAAGGLLGNLASSLGLELDGINTTIQTKASGWALTLSTSATGLGLAATTAFGAIPLAVGPPLMAAGLVVATQTALMATSAGTNFARVSTSAATSMTATGTSIGTAATAMSVRLAGALAGMAAASALRFAAIRSSAVSQTSAMATGVGAQISAMASSSATRTLGMQMGIAARFAAMRASAVSAASGMSSAVVSTLASMASRGAAAVQSGLGRIPGIVSSIGGAARNAAYSAGAAISQGFAAGMRSALGSIQAAANAMVNAANRAVRARAMIASPSKLFARLGEMLGQGLAIGIDHMQRAVAQSATALVPVDDILNSIGIISRNLKAFGGDNTPKAIVDAALALDSITRGLGGNVLTGMEYPGVAQAVWIPTPSPAPVYGYATSTAPAPRQPAASERQASVTNNYLVINRELLEEFLETVDDMKVITSPSEAAAVTGSN